MLENEAPAGYFAATAAIGRPLLVGFRLRGDAERLDATTWSLFRARLAASPHENIVPVCSVLYRPHIHPNLLWSGPAP